MKKTILALVLAGATFVTGCGDSNSFDGVSGQQGNPQPIVTPTTTPTPTVGFFVDATNGNDATGDEATGAPYATIQAAVGDAAVNDTITVRPGTYSGGVTLKNGQRLLGVASGTRPILTGQVVLGDGNTLDYLSFQGVNGNVIDGDDQTDGTITNSEFFNTINFGSGIRARSATGDWTIEDNAMTGIVGLGVDLAADSGDAIVARVNGNTFTDGAASAVSVVAAGSGTMRLQLNDNVMTNNGTNATVEVITGGPTAEFVAQIVGNTNDDVYRFSRNDLTSNLRIERLADIETLNTGARLDSPGSQAPQDAANGAAGFGTAP